MNKKSTFLPSIRPYVLIVSVLFVLIAAFGLPLTSSIFMDHGECPFMVSGTVLCAVPLTHITHWKVAFAATLVEALFLSTLVLLLLLQPRIADFSRFRSTCLLRRRQMPELPTLLQELFSQGILHPKAP